ncbi:MAG TPA: TolC family protein [Bryobacteraceae bacterium]|nr:TolC family protein [Bryobacteraceae bacterium]
MIRTGAWWLVLCCLSTIAARAQSTTSPPPPSPAAPAQPNSPASPSVRITLEQAIDFAIQHNHGLLAARSNILQSQAQEITANLRPNPTLAWDTQFIPLFHLDQFNRDYLANSAQFDLGIGYTFERGLKRQHRLQAARDQTAVTRSQVADNERQLKFDVAQQFVNVLLAESTLDFAQQDLASFQQTVSISEARSQAGDLAEGDLLKIRLQMLQFQTDVSTAKLARVQALNSLRQLVGFESVPENYDVAGQLAYQPVHAGPDQLVVLADRSRPDLLAAQQGITAARSQQALAVANGKRDLDASFNYTHTAGISSGAFFFNIEIPIFDRNQGEIARTNYAITQAQEQAQETSQQVTSDVVEAYENLHSNDEIISLYQSGYLDQASQSRDISLYAYQHGAASLLDYLDAQRSYRSTQFAYRQSLANYMLALEQLRNAVGTRNLP